MRCFLGQVLQGIVGSALLSLGLVTLEKASYHVARTLKRPYGQMHMARSQGLSPMDSKELRSPLIAMWVHLEVEPLLQLSLQMIAANGINPYPVLHAYLPQQQIVSPLSEQDAMSPSISLHFFSLLLVHATVVSPDSSLYFCSYVPSSCSPNSTQREFSKTEVISKTSKISQFLSLLVTQQLI